MRGTRLRARRRRSSTQVITVMLRPPRTPDNIRFMYQPVMLGPVPVDFILFGLILAGIAIFQNQTLRVALGGLAAVTLYKIVFSGFQHGPGIAGFVGVLAHEWVILANLFLLLMG